MVVAAIYVGVAAVGGFLLCGWSFEWFKRLTDYIAAPAGSEVVAVASSFLCCSLVAGLVGPGRFLMASELLFVSAGF